MRGVGFSKGREPEVLVRRWEGVVGFVCGGVELEEHVWMKGGKNVREGSESESEEWGFIYIAAPTRMTHLEKDS